MNDHDLQPGDVVELKSGSVRMTYQGESGMIRDADCVWFDGTDCRQAVFKHAALRKVDEESGVTEKI